MAQRLDATSEQRLARQLERLKGIERSEIRMIEADRRRFRMKYRKTAFPRASLTGPPAVKEPKINDPVILGLGDDRRPTNDGSQRQPPNKLEERDYEAIRSLIFTGGQVDLDKILCLHLLSVHVIDIDEAELLPPNDQKNGQPRIAAEESENSASDILPCYVAAIQRDERPSQFEPRSAAAQREEASHPEARLCHRRHHAAAGNAFHSAAAKMLVAPPLIYNNLLESRRGHPRVQPSLEHLLRYAHTGRTSDKSDEKMAGSSQRTRLCRKESYFVGTEASDRCRPIFICFNDQLKKFVHTVVEILRNVNLRKANVLLDMLNSPRIVTAKLSELTDFIDSLQDFSFVSVPESFTCIRGYAIEDADCRSDESSEQPVAETLILESTVSAFSNLLDDVRRSIGELLRRSSSDAGSVENLMNNMSLMSVASQSNAANQKSSRMSFGARKSIEKIEPIKEPATKSYEAIQQKFNEEASARLSKSVKQSQLYADPDRVILRRMTNSQRILVGQMCAALKTKQINNEGMAKQKIPLPVLLKPVLSRESIDYLTQGTIYAKDQSADQTKVQRKTQISSLRIDLTDFVSTKIYHEIIEVESQCQLQNFMNEVV